MVFMTCCGIHPLSRVCHNRRSYSRQYLRAPEQLEDDLHNHNQDVLSSRYLRPPGCPCFEQNTLPETDWREL